MRCLGRAADLFFALNRFERASRCYVNLVELYEKGNQFSEAERFLLRAAQCIEAETGGNEGYYFTVVPVHDVLINHIRCSRLIDIVAKRGAIEAQLGKFEQAKASFEQAADLASSDTNLWRSSCVECCFSACLCSLYQGDWLSFSATLATLCSSYAVFQSSREGSFLNELNLSASAKNLEKCNVSIARFEAISKLPAWKSALLQSAIAALDTESLT